MNNAKDQAAEIIFDPKSLKYHEDIRMFQGCPTLAVTRGGRIFLGWYAGGLGEPSMDNFNLLVYSDDKGKTWSNPLFVIPSNCEDRIHALDIQLYTDLQGVLHVQWVQNNATLYTGQPFEYRPDRPLVKRDDYIFKDFRHHAWEMTCEDPDAEALVFSEPRALYPGFLRCKPTFLKNGHQLHFAYDQMSDRYVFQRTEDGGKTFTRHVGSVKYETPFDETMAYEMENGDIRMLARTTQSELAESISHDGGFTWEATKSSGIPSANSRFFIRRLPSGRILLVNHDDSSHKRRKLTVSLSEDDGCTWPYKVCLDEREDVSYPDADVHENKIYLTYDHDRMGAREIFFTSFTEEEVISGIKPSISIVSKPRNRLDKQAAMALIEKEKLIVTLADIENVALIPLTEALYADGVHLVALSFSGKDQEAILKTIESLRELAEYWQGRMFVGVEGVLTENEVWLAGIAGAAFVFSPNTRKSVIHEARRCGMVTIPGAYTPTEIIEAFHCRADFVQLFPSEIGGSAYLKAIRKSLRHERLIVSGGIKSETLTDYLDAGAVACCMDFSQFGNNAITSLTRIVEKYKN